MPRIKAKRIKATLLREHRKRLGLLEPGDLLPLAKKAGLKIDIKSIHRAEGSRVGNSTKLLSKPSEVGRVSVEFLQTIVALFKKRLVELEGLRTRKEELPTEVKEVLTRKDFPSTIPSILQTARRTWFRDKPEDYAFFIEAEPTPLVSTPREPSEGRASARAAAPPPPLTPEDVSAKDPFAGEWSAQADAPAPPAQQRKEATEPFVCSLTDERGPQDEKPTPLPQERAGSQPAPLPVELPRQEETPVLLPQTEGTPQAQAAEELLRLKRDLEKTKEELERQQQRVRELTEERELAQEQEKNRLKQQEEELAQERKRAAEEKRRLEEELAQGKEARKALESETGLSPQKIAAFQKERRHRAEERRELREELKASEEERVRREQALNALEDIQAEWEWSKREVQTIFLDRKRLEDSLSVVLLANLKLRAEKEEREKLGTLWEKERRAAYLEKVLEEVQRAAQGAMKAFEERLRTAQEEAKGEKCRLESELEKLSAQVRDLEKDLAPHAQLTKMTGGEALLKGPDLRWPSFLRVTSVCYLILSAVESSTTQATSRGLFATFVDGQGVRRTIRLQAELRFDLANFRFTVTPESGSAEPPTLPPKATKESSPEPKGRAPGQAVPLRREGGGQG